MIWLAFTFLAVLSRSIYSIATKLLSQNVEVKPVTQTVLLTTVSGILAIIISPFIGGISFAGIDKYIPVVIILILSQAFGNVFFFKGLKTLDAGTTQIAFASVLVWGAILSFLFLDSIYSLVQLVGILLLLASIIMVQYTKNIKSINKGVVYIGFAAFLFAIFQVSSADLSKTISPGAYLMLAYFGTSIILSILFIKTMYKDIHELKKQVRNTALSTLFASGMSLMYFIFAYLAYKSAPNRGIVVVLLTGQVILSVLLGIVFLHERDNMKRKIIAGILAFIAGILIILI